jgi:isopenicillin-N N-acyltransferase like protein
VTVRIVRAGGDARGRGRAVGTALADLIHPSLEFYRRAFRRRGLGPDDLPRVLGPYRAAARAELPRLVEELEGTAEGAGVSPWELFAVNAFEEIETLADRAPAGRADRCTAFAVSGPDGTVLAHNEQWYAADRGMTAVVVTRPDDGPAFASPTVATCLPAVGMNAAGAAQAIMSLSARDDAVGIPRVVVSRSSLQARDPVEAVARAAPPGRAGGYAHLVAFPGGRRFTVETSATGHAVVEGPAHTNHYLDRVLAARSPEPGPGSLGRLQRVADLIEERAPATPEESMEVLRDHEGPGQPICLHADPAQGDEAEAVIFAMVCHLEERRMWVAPGYPCETPFEEIDLREAFAP